jgi:Fic family protein
MVNIVKVKKGNSIYYYLQHTTRHGLKLINKRIYLGTKIPADIDKIEEDFSRKIYREEGWYDLFDQIKKRHSEEIKQMSLTAREKKMSQFAMEFTYNTQRIEGSTLTPRETINLLEKGLTPSREKPIEDTIEAKTHEKVFYEMLEHSSNRKKDLSLQLVKEWHYKLFHETKPDIAGQIRKHQVGISGSKFKPPLAVEVFPMLEEFFKWYNKNKKKHKIHPIELAALVHLKFVSIHPFVDGNGRISRLMMNFVLNKNGYPMLDIKYEGRNRYYTALERSHIEGIKNTFVLWFMKRYVKENEPYVVGSERRFLYNIK